jgi:hypothetical protein
VAVKADLGGGLTEIVIGVIILITSAIEIIKELIVFIGYKASDLEVFRVAVAKRVKINIKVIRQQQ